ACRDGHHDRSCSSLSTPPYLSAYSSPVFFQSKFDLLRISAMLTEISLLIPWLVAKQWIELNPGHVSSSDIGDVASGTFGHGLFRCGFFIRHWMVPKSEEAPAVSLCKALTVLYCQVDPVVLAVKVAPARCFCTRAVWERRIKNAG